MEWIKATEKLPDRFTPNHQYTRHVLCYNDGVIFIGFYFYDENHWTNGFDDEERTNVEYWQILPHPPIK